MKMAFKRTYEDSLHQRLEPFLVQTLMKTIPGIFNSTLETSTSDSLEKNQILYKSNQDRKRNRLCLLKLHINENKL